MKPTSVIVIGAGGHAKVCIEILVAAGYSVANCIGAPDSENACLHVPVLKGKDDVLLESLYQKGFTHVFVAIGDNKLRKKLAKLAIQKGYSILNAISPNAVISPSAIIGSGVAIMAGVVINAKAIISDYSIINTGATVDHDCIVGEASHLAPQTALAGTVCIGQNSFLGIGTVVIPEIKIGDSVVVGAGSVVIKNMPDSVMCAGTPAVIKKSI
jgi:UDP-perosamine 4-acetyltransferase